MQLAKYDTDIILIDIETEVGFVDCNILKAKYLARRYIVFTEVKQGR